MTLVLVDLGRSHVRVVRVGPAGTDVDVRTAGGAGLTDPGGAAGVAALVGDAVRPHVPDHGDWQLAVCAPGVIAGADPADDLARALVRAFTPSPDQVLVASDSAAWQVGAFAGGDGAVVTLGTGAVVVARVGTTITRLDGLGLLLGDVGGGAWIGLHALRTAADTDPVRSARSAALRQAATTRFGPPPCWPSMIGAPDLASRLAGFVPDVAHLASSGDAVAAGVLDDAAAGLARTLRSLPDELPLCLTGGTAPVLAERLARTTGRAFVPQQGDAVDGLRHLLRDPGPYAGEVHRAAASRSSALVAAPPDTADSAATADTAVQHDTDLLPTEAVAEGARDLDIWPTEQLVARLAAGHQSATAAVLDAVPALARAADLVGAALAGTGRLVYVGAGTPGRLAVQDAAELVPTFALDPARAIVLLAGGERAGSMAVEGAEDDISAGAHAIDSARITDQDVVVGISASGRTPFVLSALQRASERGAATVGIGNNSDSPLSRLADVAVDLPTGAEMIAGSTRLSAGTAQKIALNTLSTAALVRAGGTFGPWMVDVLATNDKLRRRSVRIVRDAAGVSDSRAAAALDAAGRSVQVAIVALLRDVDADTARDLLRTRGTVRAAVTP